LRQGQADAEVQAAVSRGIRAPAKRDLDRWIEALGAMRADAKAAQELLEEVLASDDRREVRVEITISRAP